MAIVLPKFPRRRSPSGGPAEAHPAVNVSLCREDGIYPAGGMLRATWQISRVPLERLQGIEISVMWHTEGKGDEDLHVHHFQRISEHQIRRTGLADQQQLQCQLPITPLSYHGRLIRIVWCLRMRLFLAGGKEVVAEQPFYLAAQASSDSLVAAMNPATIASAAAPANVAPGGAMATRTMPSSAASVSGSVWSPAKGTLKSID